jgi:hypothetical protein
VLNVLIVSVFYDAGLDDASPSKFLVMSRFLWVSLRTLRMFFRELGDLRLWVCRGFIKTLKTQRSLRTAAECAEIAGGFGQICFALSDAEGFRFNCARFGSVVPSP